MDINHISSDIPQSKEKQELLKQKNVENIYLGQGLIFVPPETAVQGYNEFLEQNFIDPRDFPLNLVQRKGQGGDFYNSPRLDAIWKDMQDKQFKNGSRSPKAFGTFIRTESRETMEKLFQIDKNEIATMQVDNLMQALRCVQKVIPELIGEHVSRVILPAKYKYSGHTDFTTSAKKVGTDMEVIEVPEIQIDGSQDLKGLEEAFMQVKRERRIAIFIDQEHNNNASGFDRNPSQNEDLSKLLKKYEGIIFYFGDDAYKGLKEDILAPYPLMQQLIADKVTAFHYTSFSKVGNYHDTPGFKSILTATQGEFANKEALRDAFEKIQRSEGIGATADGAILMNQLVKDAEFLKEVRVLKLYLMHIRARLSEGLKDTELASLFSEKTNGIFRCMPPDITKKLNSGPEQAITVGDRINIWPLGDPKDREFFLKLLENQSKS